MLKRLVFVLILLLGLNASASAERYALTNARLIDGTGAPARFPVTLLIRDEKIEAVQADIPKDYPVVDLKGMSVLPGFINAHVHGAYDEQRLRAWLRAGVTVVRDLGHNVASEKIIQIRERLNQSRENARIVSATPLVGPLDGYGSQEIETLEEGLNYVDLAHKQGLDILKLTFEDSVGGKNYPVLDQAIGSAMSARAHQYGMPVACHVTHTRLLPRAIAANVDEISHMVTEPLPEELAQEIVRRDIAWIPTLELWKGVEDRYGKHGFHVLDVAIANTALFHRLGGTIALGTDFDGYSTPFDLGFPKTEVGLLKQAGLSPMDIIVAATRNAAKVSGKLAEMGTIEPGKLANLLIVEEDPLQSVEALYRPAQIWHRGQRIEPEAH